MGKYANLEKDIFGVFDTGAWKAENIKTFPSNFIASGAGDAFIRVSPVPSGQGLNPKSVSGILIIDIFIPAGHGPGRASTIADKLDTYLVRKLLSSASGSTSQFHASSLAYVGLDRDNASLFHSTYSIPFNHFGVNS